MLNFTCGGVQVPGERVSNVWNSTAYANLSNVRGGPHIFTFISLFSNVKHENVLGNFLCAQQRCMRPLVSCVQKDSSWFLKTVVRVISRFLLLNVGMSRALLVNIVCFCRYTCVYLTNDKC